MSELLLFTDGSVNIFSKTGYGAYLAVTDLKTALPLLKEQVHINCFKKTSSTKLELQTLLWALKEIGTLGQKITVYTDSQNIIGLPRRRARLEKNNYYSKNKTRLNNYELYQEFYQLWDQLNFQLVKVCGHQSHDKKNQIDHVFALVDQAARDAQRKKR